MSDTGLDLRVAALVALAMFLVFNANGREIGSFDSQPTKFAARELLLRGTLSLNHVVGGTPQFIERPGFQRARDGRYRSAYSPMPAVAAAAVVWPLWKLGILDIRAPLAPNTIAAIASSFFVAVAVALAFVLARMELSRRRALAVALSLGLGTGLWSTASQTLWQHETAIFGLTLAVLSLAILDRRWEQETDASGTAPGQRGRWTAAGWAVAVGLGVGLAAASRLQLVPVVAVLLTGVLVRTNWRLAILAAAAAAALVLPVCEANLRWFGSPLGAAPMLEALHESVHDTTGTFSLRSGGLTGLLLSPNRGLFVFSPIVLIAILGVPALLRSAYGSALLWCSVAAWAQFTLYASYVVWWGGHTYGPRYMLDVLPLLLPLGIAAAAEVRGRVRPAVTGLALAWSIGVAAIGAFNHPEGRWNNDPADVDRAHGRIWEWRDNQILRTWRGGGSSQNFSLFTRDAFRRARS